MSGIEEDETNIVPYNEVNDNPRRRRKHLTPTQTSDTPTEIAASSEYQSKIQTGKNFSSPSDEFAMWEEITDAVQDRYIQLSKTFPGGNRELKKEENFYRLVNQVIEDNPAFRSGVAQIDVPRLVELLRAYHFGYGALEDYMRLPELEELYFNDYKTGFYKLRGSKHRIDQKIFNSEGDLIQFVKRVANENNHDFNLQKANLDATLRDGSRLSATLPPMAVDGPEFVIRKHPDRIIPIQEMIEDKVITEELSRDLKTWIVGGLNIILSGGTSSGKTTMINTLIQTYVPQDDRVLIIESNKELKARTLDTKYFQTRADATREDPENDITLRDLVRWSLRKDPDRIVIGEVRGPEALDALTAWNSGHDGSFCTLHANNSLEAVSKLQDLCQQARNAPTERSIRSLISQSVDIVIQVIKDRNGDRRVSEVSQILHRYKYDVRNPQLVEFVEQAKENNILLELDDLMIMPLYETRNGELVKVSNIIPINRLKR